MPASEDPLEVWIEFYSPEKYVALAGHPAEVPVYKLLTELQRWRKIDTQKFDAPLTVTITPRDDGGISISCEELPGLILSSTNVAGVMADIIPAAIVLRNYVPNAEAADVPA